jgi:hypothetical protein
MGRECSTNGENGNAYRILVGKPEGKRPLGRSKRRWRIVLPRIWGGGVRDVWMAFGLDLLHLHTQLIITIIYCVMVISILHSSLLHTLVSSVYYSLHYPFPGNGFYHMNYNSLTELHTPNIIVQQHT